MHISLPKKKIYYSYNIQSKAMLRSDYSDILARFRPKKKTKDNLDTRMEKRVNMNCSNNQRPRWQRPLTSAMYYVLSTMLPRIT